MIRPFRSDLTFLPILIIAAAAASMPSCRTMEDSKNESSLVDQASFANSDSNSDGKLSRRELATHLHREALAEFDLNDDGAISADEWAKAKPAAGEEDTFFHRLDKDSDGKIDPDEAIDYINQHEKFVASFEALDQDGDQHLLWEELSEGASDVFNFVLFAPGE